MYAGETCLTHIQIYAHAHRHTSTYAIGKASMSGVSQGRLRLRALIDCSYAVCVP